MMAVHSSVAELMRGVEATVFGGSLSVQGHKRLTQQAENASTSRHSW